VKTKPGNTPRSQQEQKYAQELPRQQTYSHWKMQQPYRPRDELWEQRHVRVRLKKFSVKGEKSGMQPFQYSRKVDFCVFYARMVTIQKKRANG
jgi:hypothetical protein